MCAAILVERVWSCCLLVRWCSFDVPLCALFGAVLLLFSCSGFPLYALFGAALLLFFGGGFLLLSTVWCCPLLLLFGYVLPLYALFGAVICYCYLVIFSRSMRYRARTSGLARSLFAPVGKHRTCACRRNIILPTGTAATCSRELVRNTNAPP